MVFNNLVACGVIPHNTTRARYDPPMTKSTYGCHNRQPLRDTALVQQGWARIGYHVEARHTVSIPDEMTKECQYRKTELGKVDPKCGGCKHK